MGPQVSETQGDGPESALEASVILIVRNSADRIEEPVRSFARQSTSLPHEVIVVDNASTDATPRVLETVAKEFSHVRLVHEPELGPGAARHGGARASRGKLLVFVDGDMVAAPDFLTHHLSAHMAHPGGCVVGAISSHPGRHPFERMLAYIYDGPRANLANRALTYEDCWGGNISMGRELYFKLGGFHDVYGGFGSDANLAQRMADQAVALQYAPAAMTHHRMHDRFGPRLRRAYVKGVAVGIHKARREHVAQSATEMVRGGSWPRVTVWGCLAAATVLEPFDRGSGIPMKPLCFLYDMGLRAAMRRGQDDFDKGRIPEPLGRAPGVPPQDSNARDSGGNAAR
jgi:hypothetical protein